MKALVLIACLMVLAGVLVGCGGGTLGDPNADKPRIRTISYARTDAILSFSYNPKDGDVNLGYVTYRLPSDDSILTDVWYRGEYYAGGNYSCQMTRSGDRIFPKEAIIFFPIQIKRWDESWEEGMNERWVWTSGTGMIKYEDWRPTHATAAIPAGWPNN